MMAMLSARLADPSMVFYPQGHVRSVCLEALRCWQAMSTVHRGRFAFNLVAGTSFYDIADTAAAPSTLIPRTLTGQDLVADLQYALMEHVNDWSMSTTWTGTEMFTMADLTNALQRRRNQFLLETGSVLTYAEIVSGSPPNGRIPLADNIIDVRRAAWRDTSNVYTNLWRVDERQLNSMIPGWAINPARPEGFSTIVVPPLTIQLGPVPADSGTIGMVSVNTAADVSIVGATPLDVPNDYAWVIKFGALADLLSKDGEARNPQRAAHCEQRYQQGVMLARLGGTVLNLEVNGAQTPITSLQSLDAMQPGWQTIATNSGTPTVGALAGLNLLALSPVDNAGSSVTIDCVRNAPIPANDAAFVELAREHLESVLDYAVYLARFKEEGIEFQMVWPLVDNLIRLAMDHNGRLAAQAQHEQALREQANREYRRRNMRIEDAAA